MAAHTYDRFAGAEITPEQGVRFIQHERTRKSIVAVALAVAAIIATLGAVYMVYRDVPAPHSPANAKVRLLEPYR